MQTQSIKKQALLALLLSIALTQTSYAQTKTIEHTSHPLSSEELFQRITTLIELPLPQINKKNVEKIFGVTMKRIRPKSNRWVFYAKNSWSLNIENYKKNDKLKFYFNFYTVWFNPDKDNQNKYDKDSDSPPCINNETLKAHIEKNHWGKEGIIFRAEDGGIAYPPNYEEKPYIKNQKQLGFLSEEVLIVDNKKNCIGSITILPIER